MDRRQLPLLRCFLFSAFSVCYLFFGIRLKTQVDQLAGAGNGNHFVILISVLTAILFDTAYLLLTLFSKKERRWYLLLPLCGAFCMMLPIELVFPLAKYFAGVQAGGDGIAAVTSLEHVYFVGSLLYLLCALLLICFGRGRKIKGE